MYNIIKAVQEDETSTTYPHLKAFFFRVCKLLFYGIKPVFVFDGGVPYLKYKTMVSVIKDLALRDWVLTCLLTFN